MLRAILALLTASVLAGCGTWSDPFSADIGGDVIEDPPIENFRGQPVAQLTFITGVDPAAETTFLLDYVELGLDESSPDDADDDPALLAPDYELARTNMSGMFAKNVYYAVHLAKYLKLKAEGDFVVVLNPVTLKHAPGRGYFYEPFEEDMPPADIDLSFLAYVHPLTLPSTRGEVLTTYGETLAPVASLRMDPVFNPDLEGAIGLTDVVLRSAHDPDGRGARAQLADHINVEKYGKLGSDYSEFTETSGPFQPGMLFELNMETFSLEEEPPADELLSAAVMESADYEPGSYYAYEFYEGYYRIIMSALQSVDNRRAATDAQKDYWAFYESSAKLEPVMLQRSDRRKYELLLKYKRAELAYLQDRDDNWMKGLLETSDFKFGFNKLRDAEQAARDDYINAQIEAGVGIALAILGAVAVAYSASEDSSGGALAGSALVGVGVAMVSRAVADLETIDVAFTSSFASSYDAQKAYVFESAEGERVEVRAASFDQFKQHLKTRYDKRFVPRMPAPQNKVTQDAVPTS